MKNMREAVGLPVAVLALVLAVAACGNDDNDVDDGNGQPVSMIDFGYVPATITAEPGETLTLNVSNDGDLPHTFTIDGVMDSGSIGAGASDVVEFSVEEAGTLTFYCTIHGAEQMSGRVTVNGGGAAGGNPEGDVGADGAGDIRY